MVAVDVLRDLVRTLWFGVAIFFALAGLAQLATYIRGIRRGLTRTVYLPFIFFGFALFILSIASGIIGIHSGEFLEFALSRLVVLTLIGLSGTLFTVGALTISGYKEYYGVPIVMFSGLLVTAVVYTPILTGINIYIMFIGLSLGLIGFPLIVFGYMAYGTKRFAPLAYSISLFTLFLALVLYFFPSIPYAIEAAISISASMLLSGSALSRVRSKVAGLTYSFAFLSVLIVFSIFLSISSVLSFLSLLALFDWGISGFLAFIVAGYLGGRYFASPSKPTFYLAAFFYFFGILSYLSLMLEILPVLPFAIDTTYIQFLNNISYLISGAFLVFTAMALLRNERLTTPLMVYLTFSITVLFFFAQDTPVWVHNFLFFSVFLLYGFPIAVFGMLVMLYAGRGGIAYYRALTLFAGSLFFMLSYFFGILYIYSPWPVVLPVTGFYAILLPLVLRLVAMTSFALGITGILIRRTK